MMDLVFDQTAEMEIGVENEGEKGLVVVEEERE